MSYITFAELTARYPGLAVSSETNVNSDLIYYSEMEINSRLGSHFDVPFAGNHPTIKDLTIDLAWYRELRMKNPEKAEKIRKSVIDRIDDIKAGKDFIFTGSGTILEQTKTGEKIDIWSSTEDYHPVHSMLDAEDPLTIVDSSRLYDEANERV